eukprot:scaffold26409_cov112-Isochrysis_galbana.AAC.2
MGMGGTDGELALRVALPRAGVAVGSPAGQPLRIGAARPPRVGPGGHGAAAVVAAQIVTLQAVTVRCTWRPSGVGAVDAAPAQRRRVALETAQSLLLLWVGRRDLGEDRPGAAVLRPVLACRGMPVAGAGAACLGEVLAAEAPGGSRAVGAARADLGQAEDRQRRRLGPGRPLTRYSRRVAADLAERRQFERRRRLLAECLLCEWPHQGPDVLGRDGLLWRDEVLVEQLCDGGDGHALRPANLHVGHLG